MKSQRSALAEIEKSLNRVKVELASIAFLIKGLQGEQGGADFYGLGVLLDRHWRTLEKAQDRLLELLNS
jgi:transposase